VLIALSFFPSPLSKKIRIFLISLAIADDIG
jgi:Na+/H+ antiporter NhaA